MTANISSIDIDRVVAAFDVLGCAQLFDASGGRASALPVSLPSRTPGLRCAGPAFTISTDNDMLPALQALHAAPERSVLYIQNRSPVSEALAGDIFLTACKSQNLAGLIVEGAVRDIDQLPSIGVPVFSRDVTFVSAKTADMPAKSVPETLKVGEVAIESGDWIFADGDGVLVIPQAHVTAVVKAGQLLHGTEEELRQTIANGRRLGDVIGLNDFVAGTGQLRFAV